jgi:hypothetical protein
VQKRRKYPSQLSCAAVGCQGNTPESSSKPCGKILRVREIVYWCRMKENLNRRSLSMKGDINDSNARRPGYVVSRMHYYCRVHECFTLTAAAQRSTRSCSHPIMLTVLHLKRVDGHRQSDTSIHQPQHKNLYKHQS